MYVYIYIYITHGTKWEQTHTHIDICHVYVMYMSCIRHVYVMYMQCICHVYVYVCIYPSIHGSIDLPIYPQEYSRGSKRLYTAGS